MEIDTEVQINHDILEQSGIYMSTNLAKLDYSLSYPCILHFRNLAVYDILFKFNVMTTRYIKLSAGTSHVMATSVTKMANFH